MRISVRLFAAARQIAGQELVTVDCPDPATVAELRAAVVRQCPELEPLLAHVRFAVNAEYAHDETALQDGDDVACIPPVSGG